MSQVRVQQAFETWARINDLDLSYRNVPGVGQFYTCSRTLLAYEAWQASRAAVVVKLPVDRTAEMSPSARVLVHYHRDVRNGLIEAIEAAGLKVAP